MNIHTTTIGQAMDMALTGYMDCEDAARLGEELRRSIPRIRTLTLDLSGLESLSPAGVKVLLAAQGAMNRRGGMTVRNAVGAVRDTLVATGLADIIHIE